MLRKISKYPLLLGCLTCFIILTLLSISMMHYLEDFEDPRFQLPDLTLLHFVWYGVGCIGFGILFIVGKFRSTWFPFLFSALAMTILGGSILQGETSRCLPYFRFNSLYINATEASVLALLVPISFFMAYYQNRFLTSFFVSGLLILFLWLGSANSTLAIGLAISTITLCDYRERPHSNTLFLSILSFVVVLVIILKGIFFNSNKPSESIKGSYLFTLYDPATSANGHTELVLSHIAERFGLSITYACLILILLFIAQLAALSFTTNNRGARFIIIGFATFLTGQMLFDILVATNLIVNPASGVLLPFVSYGGSQLVLELTILGGIVGLLHTNFKNQ